MALPARKPARPQSSLHLPKGSPPLLSKPQHEAEVIIVIKFQCDCGNEDPSGFDMYVSQSELCDILTVVCKYCGDTREEFVASNRDSIMLKI